MERLAEERRQANASEQLKAKTAQAQEAANVARLAALQQAVQNRRELQQRAQAAAAYLRDKGVPGARISSDGVGYLAPVASNLTDAGREANRRVEAMLLPVE